MKPGEEQYAVACSVPSNAEGLHIVNTTNAPRGDDLRHFPIRSRSNMPEGAIDSQTAALTPVIGLDRGTFHSTHSAHKGQ